MRLRKLNDFPTAEFEVIVDGETTTTHKVYLDKDHYEKLTNSSVSPEKLIEKSFEFLLAREPNTSILKEFNLQEISKYFPEYESQILSLI